MNSWYGVQYWCQWMSWDVSEYIVPQWCGKFDACVEKKQTHSNRHCVERNDTNIKQTLNSLIPKTKVLFLEIHVLKHCSTDSSYKSSVYTTQSIEQCFSTAGPQTGTCPRQIFKGTENFY
jgi:hypothetical protein